MQEQWQLKQIKISYSVFYMVIVNFSISMLCRLPRSRRITYNPACAKPPVVGSAFCPLFRASAIRNSLLPQFRILYIFTFLAERIFVLLLAE
jgi:hypothetical protein